MFEMSLHRSNYLFIFFTILHTGFLFAFLMLDNHLLAYSVLFIGFASYGYFLHNHFSLSVTKSITKVCCNYSGEWLLTNRKGKMLNVALRGDSIITSFMVVLNFYTLSPRKKRISVIVFNDSTDKQSFRRLLVWLRHS